MNQKQNEAKNTKRSDEPLKSNMKWSHINDECNDGMDNDLEPLREGHSSRSQNIQQNEYKEWRVSESSHTNSRQQDLSNKATLEH